MAPDSPSTVRLTRRHLLAAAATAIGAGAALTAKQFPALRPLGVPFGQPVSSAREMSPFEGHIGWAYTCDHMIPPEQVRADMQRMRDLGCTTAYIGHDNPARAGWGSAEPGLSFAVWYEIEVNGPEVNAAREKLQVITTGIEAARDAGLLVVLPIDYQIQQGRLWSAHHPDALAVGPDGRPLNSHGDPVASPYAEIFREHKRAYYRWVQDHLLAHYPHIVALNLGDEPVACDYSHHAMAAFERRFGRPWDAADDWERGDFQAGVVADYAIWSAWEWYALNPTVRTLFTLHIERSRPFFPAYEPMFQHGPPTFVISSDTHLHDAPSWVPLTPQDRNLLHNLCRQLGLWSWSSGRDVMPWHSVNGWGLVNGGIPEALDNHGIVVNEILAAGGRIAKTLAWAWNIRWQGLFRDEGAMAHVDKEAMLAAISAAMRDAQPRLATRREPDVHTVHYFPSKHLYRLIGAARPTSTFDQHRWFGIQEVDFTASRQVALTDGPALEEARSRGWPIVLVGGDDPGPTESINYLPGNVREVQPGTIWFGDSTLAADRQVWEMVEAERGQGTNWLSEYGLYKGSIFVNGGERRFYEYVVFERAILHQVADRFETTLVFRDLANGRLELGEGNRRFMEFPPEVAERVRATPITGDPGSLAPSFTTLRPYLTLIADNQDQPRTGEVVNTAIAADGTLSVYDASPVGEIVYSWCDNGHNVPNVIANEIARRYGSDPARWWPRIGRPIGRAFWMQSMLGAEGLRWVLSQPFERGILTYHPHYTDQPAFIVQSALIGNLFLRIMTGSDAPYHPDFHDRYR